MSDHDPTCQNFLKLDLTRTNWWDRVAQNVEFIVKCTPPKIEDFSWIRHLFNLNGKIRKQSIYKKKNVYVVLLYMTIYIYFVTKIYNAFLVLNTI